MDESTTTTTEVLPEGLSLGQLIAVLEVAHPAQRVRLGFTNPHSYRGDYVALAFEPKRDTTVGEMLAEARSAMGRTFHGYKGGEYTMEEWTPCWLANYGATGETLGAVLLSFMLESANVELVNLGALDDSPINAGGREIIGRAAHAAWKGWITTQGYADHAWDPERLKSVPMGPTGTYVVCSTCGTEHDNHHPEMVDWGHLTPEAREKYTVTGMAGHSVCRLARAFVGDMALDEAVSAARQMSQRLDVAAEEAIALRDVGIPCWLFCPECGVQHIDAPEPENGWTNPPHRTHKCAACGHLWRPYPVATFGVAAWVAGPLSTFEWGILLRCLERTGATWSAPDGSLIGELCAKVRALAGEAGDVHAGQVLAALYGAEASEAAGDWWAQPIGERLATYLEREYERVSQPGFSGREKDLLEMLDEAVLGPNREHPEPLRARVEALEAALALIRDTSGEDTIICVASAILAGGIATQESAGRGKS